MTFLVHLILTSALLLLVAYIVRGVRIESWSNAFLAALVLGIVNAIIRPIMVFLTLPLTILTFGLFLFVVNALMLQITAAFVPGMKIEGCGAALWGSFLLSLLNVVVGVVAGVI